MLRALRNQTQSIFFKIFLVLLICGFALWGVGDLTGGNTSKSILKTNNQNITIERAINERNRNTQIVTTASLPLRIFFFGFA